MASGHYVAKYSAISGNDLRKLEFLFRSGQFHSGDIDHLFTWVRNVAHTRSDLAKRLKTHLEANDKTIKSNEEVILSKSEQIYQYGKEIAYPKSEITKLKHTVFSRNQMI